MGTILRRTGGRLAALPAAVLLVTACAGAGGAGGATVGASWRRMPGDVSNGQFTPGREAARQYGPDASRTCPRGAALDAVVDALANVAKRNGRPPPELDGRVCAVAEAFLGWNPQRDGAPRPRVLSFVSHYFGLPLAVDLPTVGEIETEDPRVISERVVEAVAISTVNANHPRVGFVTQRIRKGATRFAFVVLDAPVEVDPVPRRLDLGQQARLSGRLLGGATQPEVAVSDASGQLTRTAPQSGTAFAADLRCGDRPGRIQVEVRASLAGRSDAVASFPVLCGEDPPATVALAAEPWPGDAAGAERKILDLVNGERARAGLSPVKADAALMEIARGISEDLAARSGAPGGPDLGERLKKQGIVAPLVLQSAAADRTFDRAHDRLVVSPSNRANLMNPEVTSAGVGAVAKTDAEGRGVVYVTELLVKELPPVDVVKVRQQIRDAVAQKRQDARTNAVADDPTLDEVAQRFAEALAKAGGALPKEQQAALTAPLTKGFRTVTMVSGAKQEPLDFAEEPQTTAPGKLLGIGAAQGHHPVLGRNATYVVLMVGTRK